MPLILWALLHPINDITTTLEAPPRLEQEYPESFKDIQRKLYPDLKPYTSSESPEQLFERAVQLAKVQPHWTVVSTEKSRLQALVVSSLFRFKDDVVIEVRKESSGSSLHMRSRSRVGQSDLGANFKRIHKFLQDLDAK